ncbi:methyl-accepting chemotaxis protein [Azohydromonas caseinilytica]|uniref:HAMP domain-containing protein n=1 Tax=Azohydromonas caseinilytica TaxID=2728836 RepID=A0A848FAU8_9BURK|nr:methyl-accepting chemotaxis protein [Azohydromonas caseinilytica]NML16452.1 HAMP domain-containing protein [Azohydromonas caseinilytica]
MSIGTRLALSFAGSVALIALLALTAFIELSSAQGKAEELTGLQRERLELATEWRDNILVNSQRTLAIGYSADKTLAGHFAEDIKKIVARTTEIQKRFGEIETAPEALAIMERLAKIRSGYLKAREELFKAKNGSDDPAAVAKLTQEFRTATQAYIEASTELFKYEQARSAAAGHEVANQLSSTKISLVVAAVACAVMACILGWLMARSIVRPLSLARASANRIAGGDLSVDVPSGSQDEVGQLLRAIGAMQDALRRLVGDIRASVESIGVASAEVAAGNQDLSARTEQASASLQQTASSVEEISSTMRRSSESAAEADRFARSASEVAGNGGQAVLRVVSTMDAISQSSQRIGDIVGVIDGIAFQTNILALNAAVEAARAGEQGRGFAVVASEVRALAQRSASAAKEIKDLIAQSVERIATGAREAQEAGRTIEGVVTSVRQVSSIVSEITTAAVEQTRGIGEVNEAVAQLDRVTQQNAALVEQSAAAATSLRDQAAALSHSVQRFRLT